MFTWTLIKRIIWLKVTILSAGSDPTSDLVGLGRVDYMELTS